VGYVGRRAGKRAGRWPALWLQRCHTQMSQDGSSSWRVRQSGLFLVRRSSKALARRHPWLANSRFFPNRNSPAQMLDIWEGLCYAVGRCGTVGDRYVGIGVCSVSANHRPPATECRPALLGDSSMALPISSWTALRGRRLRVTGQTVAFGGTPIRRGGADQ
jgi:hypothetical protein